jgi:DNA-binding response OmpR family regulator
MSMWILVVSRSARLDLPEGGVETLLDLGCRVRAADFWDPLDDPEIAQNPPAAVLVEALDRVDAARAASLRLRSSPVLAAVPALIAVTVDAVQSLDANDGFDDFVLVPYVPAELYMRIRRIEWRHSEFSGQERIKVGPLCLDFAAHEVTVDGRPVDLTQQEFALLKFLCENRGRVYRREQLLARVWKVQHYEGSRTVDIHMRRLRMKLGSAAIFLETIRGVGYKMKAS